MTLGNITKENYCRFRKQYQSPLDRGAESFMFEGRETLTAYAEYVVEYCDMIIKGAIHGK